jgi:hypothetical protein
MATEVKRPATWIWYLAGIVGITILALFLLRTCTPQTQPSAWQKRDTVYVDKYVYVRDTIRIHDTIVQPNVTVYKPTTEDGNTRIVYKKDTMRLNDTITLVQVNEKHDTITRYVSTSFLTQFPNNPKLIQQRIYKDSTSYDLMLVNGEVVRNSYPLNLDTYDYVWDNWQMVGHKKKTTSKFLKQVKGESYLYTTYEFLKQAPRLAIDYAIMYKNVGIYGRSTGSIKSPFFQLELGTKVKLK